VFFITELNAQDRFNPVFLAGTHEFQGCRRVVDVCQYQGFDLMRSGGFYQLTGRKNAIAQTEKGVRVEVHDRTQVGLL
jgi:hypothetical protein